MHPASPDVFVVAVVVFFSGLLVGLSKAGFAGLAMATTPLIACYTDAGFATAVSLPILFAGDIAVGWRFYGKWDVRTAATMLPGAAVGVIVGAKLLSGLSASGPLFNRTLGCVAIFFALFQWWYERRRREEPAEPATAPVWIGSAAGFATGVVSTIAHQGGIVSNLYLVSQRLTKERFAATAMLVYFCVNGMKMGPYLLQHRIAASTLPYSVVGIPAVVLGVLLGARWVERMNPKVFANWVVGLVVLMGLKLAVWPG